MQQRLIKEAFKINVLKRYVKETCIRMQMRMQKCKLIGFFVPKRSVAAICKIALYICTYTYMQRYILVRLYVGKKCVNVYGVVTISRLLTIIGLFCRILSLL